jgi:hypothetical protein
LFTAGRPDKSIRELEWIRREEGCLGRMSEEKLAIYNSVLKEQTISLERELNEMLQHPRYQPLVVLDGPFNIRRATWPKTRANWMNSTPDSNPCLLL